MQKSDLKSIRDLLKQDDESLLEIKEEKEKEKVNYSYFGEATSYLQSKNQTPIKVNIYGDFSHFEKATAYFMLKKAGVFFQEAIDKNFDIGWFWDPRITISKTVPKIRERSKKVRLINFFLKDTSKDFVAKTVEEHFGYTFKVDPNTYQGYCIAKHNGNGTKSCFFLKCPINADEIFHDHCYQKIINFSSPTERDVLFEIRVPIFRNIIPFVFFKRRSKGLRFTSKNRSMTISKALDYLSAEECESIISYCQKVGLEYGELDILRCDESGKIYIIDVNNTPWWPPNNLGDIDRNIALNLMWNAFLEGFLPQKFANYHIPDANIDDFVPENKPRGPKKVFCYNEIKFVSTKPYSFNYVELLKEYHKSLPKIVPKLNTSKPPPTPPKGKDDKSKNDKNEKNQPRSLISNFLSTITPFSI